MNTVAKQSKEAASRKRRAFAEAIEAGHTGKDAAILAGYSEATAATAGCRLLKHPDVKAEQARIRAGRVEPVFTDPLEFLIAVARGETNAPRLRVRAAIALLPYMHHQK